MPMLVFAMPSHDFSGAPRIRAAIDFVRRSQQESRRTMGAVIRPRFGQPCFECGENVPRARVDWLRSEATLRGKSLLKSDILCVEHGRERELMERARCALDVTPRRP